MDEESKDRMQIDRWGHLTHIKCFDNYYLLNQNGKQILGGVDIRLGILRRVKCQLTEEWKFKWTCGMKKLIFGLKMTLDNQICLF